MDEPNLLDLILAKKDILEIEKYLEKLIETPNIIAREVNRVEPITGRTALHMAAAEGNFDLVKLLLDFDAPISARDANEKTCQDLVNFGKESAQTEISEIVFKKIIPLLNTRKSWQEGADSFVLNRSIRIADKAIDSIQNCEGKTAALLVGATGHGKSSLINYFLGVDYQRHRNRIRKINDISEPATVGETCTSETLYPMLYPYQDFWIADMPGYLGTRLAERICVAASTRMLTQQLGYIKGLIFVCAYKDITEDARLIVFRDTAAKIGRMIMGNTVAANNLTLAVTKKAVSNSTEESEEIEFIREELNKLKNSLKEFPIYVDLNTCFDQPYIDNVAIKYVTEILLSSPTAIVIADVTNPQIPRERFSQIFSDMASLDPANFNLSDFESDMRQFKDLMRRIIGFYGTLANEIKSRRIEKKNLSTQIQGHHLLMSKNKKELQEYKEKLKLPFDPIVSDKKISCNRQGAEKLKDLISKLEKMLIVYQSKIQDVETVQKKINNISANLLKQRVIVGEKAENSIQIINQKLQAEKNSLCPVIDKIFNDIAKELAITKKQLVDCEQHWEDLKERKKIEELKDAEIKANVPKTIKALESEIAMIAENIQKLELAQRDNNAVLENRHYELEVNQSFFKHIIKLFNVLEKTDIQLLNPPNLDQDQIALNDIDQTASIFRSPISQPIYSESAAYQAAIKQSIKDLPLLDAANHVVIVETNKNLLSKKIEMSLK